MHGDPNLGETLMVLAGPKGAGKSTLLAHALKTRIPLFGDHVDSAFQSIAQPGDRNEFRLTTAEVLARGTWASGPHLAEIARFRPPPRRLVAHVDLMNLCRAKERPFDSLRDVEANAHEMRRNEQATIFAAYGAVHVATLATDYELCAAWFNARAARLSRPVSDNDARLYAGDPAGRAAFAAIREAWNEVARSLPNLGGCVVITYDEKRIGVGPPFLPA